MAQLDASPLTEVVRREIDRQLKTNGRIFAAKPSSLLAQLTCQSFFSSGGTDLKLVLPLAAAMEFFIAAADVVDDLQDGDGDKYENVGDAAELVYLLLVCAHRSIGAIQEKPRVTELLNTFTQYELIAMGGQHDDIATSSQPDVSVDMALDIASRKSGTFGQSAAHLGSLLAARDECLNSLHAEFGSLVTTIAQLSNDIAGVWPGSDPSTDMILRRKTVPIAAGLSGTQLSYPSHYSEAFLAVTDERTDLCARHVLRDSGAIHTAWKIAEGLRRKAESIGVLIRVQNSESRLLELVMEPDDQPKY